MTSRLFKPLKLGNVELQNRVVLAPLTRLRATDEHVPLPFVADYYAQRATDPGTLLLTEATYVSPQGAGMTNAPGIWNAEQVEAWKPVTKAVHDKGSFIFSQLWAMGRAVDAAVAKKHGVDVISASDIGLSGEGKPKPRPATEEEIEQLIKDFAQAARNAIEAGFDGVEIHGANGYLPDQFLQDVSNKRTDKWGGSIENRARFPLEIAKAVVDAVGPEKVGYRMSPWGKFQDMRMEDPIPQFTYLVEGLKKLKLAYLHIVEPRVSGVVDLDDVPENESNDFIINLWDNQSPILLAGGFKGDNTAETVDARFPDRDILTVFGRWFISTPDIVYRIRNGIKLNQYDRSTFYKIKSKDGYTDYPFSEEYKREFASRI